MSCRDIELLISARIDGALQADDSVRLGAHLASCADCRATAAAWDRQHRALVQAFERQRRASHALAARVAARLPRLRADPFSRRAALVLMSAAAGLLIGLFIPRVRPAPAVSTPEHPPIAELTLATGSVSIRPPDSDAWTTLATDGRLTAGTRVRTGSTARCEFRLADGSELRLNCDSEIVLHSPRKLELERGQAWTRFVGGAEPGEVRVAGARITAPATVLDVLAQLSSVQLTVMEGASRVTSGAEQITVNAGERLTVVEGACSAPRRAENLLEATRWLNELLMLKGRDNPELVARIDDLLAQIGETKVAHAYEQDLRAMGDLCVLPLTRYLESPRSQQDREKRVEAARILADMAQPWCIADLVRLLEDADGDVRFHAARALVRLTTEDCDRAAESWRVVPPSDDDHALRCWRDWWDANRARFPSLR